VAVLAEGGIEDAASRKSIHDATDLIKIYTGFVYSGPLLVKELGTI
jgi:dihydroorotate dehydrogenase